MKFTINLSEQVVRLGSGRVEPDGSQKLFFRFLWLVLAAVTLPKQQVDLRHFRLPLLRDQQVPECFSKMLLMNRDVAQV